ncbi:MAG: hypothetical protein CBD76_00775 [Pelagibacteraceae bacterium TMED216]|nr:MAG: hypothetical protein CBD76_00775 [Pelagibacteraceae bacterium TMED216]|tara:strand:+ start:1353 stop:2435 length:1083 start_codon:yes stop_codon:yes gene_type:complete
MNKILNNYLIYNFLKIVFNGVLIFLCLGVILNLFEEIEFFKKFQIGFSLPIFVTLLYLPNLILKLAPFLIFLSAMWYFRSININKDLLSLKIFGYSNWKIVLLLATSAAVLGVFLLLMFSPLTSSLIKYYEEIKAEYSRDIDHLVSVNKNGVWIKTSGMPTKIITGKKIVVNQLIDLTVYELNEENKIISRIESKRADISKNNWIIYKPIIYSFDNEVTKELKDKIVLETDYNAEKIQSLLKNTDTISFIELLTDYDRLIQKGYNENILNHKIHSYLTLPFFLFLMVILASIFTLTPAINSQNVRLSFIAIITCVVTYYLNDLSLVLGKTNRVPMVLAIWIPILSLSLFCGIGVLQINEK